MKTEYNLYDKFAELVSKINLLKMEWSMVDDRMKTKYNLYDNLAELEAKINLLKIVGALN